MFKVFIADQSKSLCISVEKVHMRKSMILNKFIKIAYFPVYPCVSVHMRKLMICMSKVLFMCFSCVFLSVGICIYETPRARTIYKFYLFIYLYNL